MTRYSDITLEREVTAFYIPSCYTMDPIINAELDKAIAIAGGVTVNTVKGKWVDPDTGAVCSEHIDIHTFITDDTFPCIAEAITHRLYDLGEKVVLTACTNLRGQTTYAFLTEAKHV